MSDAEILKQARTNLAEVHSKSEEQVILFMESLAAVEASRQEVVRERTSLLELAVKIERGGYFSK